MHERNRRSLRYVALFGTLLLAITAAPSAVAMIDYEEVLGPVGSQHEPAPTAENDGTRDRARPTQDDSAGHADLECE